MATKQTSETRLMAIRMPKYLREHLKKKAKQNPENHHGYESKEVIDLVISDYRKSKNGDL